MRAGMGAKMVRARSLVDEYSLAYLHVSLPVLPSGPSHHAPALPGSSSTLPAFSSSGCQRDESAAPQTSVESPKARMRSLCQDSGIRGA